MEIHKKIKGLRITRHNVCDAESKAAAQKSLNNWEAVALTPEQWIQELEAGHTIQPSAFEPDSEGNFTHSKENWKGTRFICADGDNFEGGKDADEQTAVQPWTDEKGLSQRYPDIKERAYAVGQSVSSMSEAFSYRRYRLIFLFDEHITTEKHYHQILLSLAEEFPIIAPVERSPAQPVFGNARQGYNRFAILGNVLKLSDFPYQENVPEPEPEPKSKAKPQRKTKKNRR